MLALRLLSLRRAEMGIDPAALGWMSPPCGWPDVDQCCASLASAARLFRLTPPGRPHPARLGGPGACGLSSAQRVSKLAPGRRSPGRRVPAAFSRWCRTRRGEVPQGQCMETRPGRHCPGCGSGGRPWLRPRGCAATHPGVGAAPQPHFRGSRGLQVGSGRQRAYRNHRSAVAGRRVPTAFQRMSAALGSECRRSQCGSPPGRLVPWVRVGGRPWLRYAAAPLLTRGGWCCATTHPRPGLFAHSRAAARLARAAG